LTVEFHFIDGGSGKTFYRERLSEEILYRDDAISPLASYFELMDRVVPYFLSTLSDQTARTSRFLLP